MDKYFTPDELAKLWKIGKGTLAYWRRQGIGPPFFKIHGNVLYQSEDIKAYAERCKRASTSTQLKTNQGDSL